MIVVTAVLTRVVGTAAKENFCSCNDVGTIVLSIIVEAAVPTSIVLTAYYWKSCLQGPSMVQNGQRGLERC